MAHQHISHALLGLTDLTGAIEGASKAAALYQKLAAIDSANQRYQQELSVTYRIWGNALEYSGNPREALAHYQEVLRIREALAAREPTNREFQRDVMTAHAMLGDLFVNASLERPDFEGALAHNRKRFDIAELLVRQDSHDKDALIALSTALWRVGTCLRLLGRVEEALRHLSRGVEITRDALAGNPTRYSLRSNAVSLEAEIARALEGQEKWREALAHSRTAVESGERLLVETPSGREVPRRNLLRFYDLHVKVLGRLGKPDEVRASSRRILELAEETHPKKISGKFVVYTAPNALTAAGEAYESLARNAESPSARLAHQREACSWFGRSLERWNDLRDAGSTMGTYQTRPAEVKEKLAACQAKVSGSRAAR